MIKIGSLGCVVSLMTFYVLSQAQDITLSVRDTHGMPVSTCIRGIPYSVHITTRGSLSQGHPSITLDLPYTVQRHNSQSIARHIENGVSSTIYTYTITFNSCGTYTVGPAHIDSSTHRAASNSVNVAVVEQSNTRADVRAILSFQLGTPTAYVGQDIPCVLRFSYIPNHITLEQMVKAEISDISSSPWTGPFTGTEDIRGTVYQYLEWHWTIRFSKAGTYDVPAFRADYADDTKRRQNYSPFSMFFNDVPLQTIYSNTQRITVNMLPFHVSGTQAIGTASSFSVTCDKKTCAVGDAIVLSLVLVGTGNFIDCAIPLLSNIPSAIKYYESKKETIDTPQGAGVKYEYVLQPLQDGVWEIPPQEYTYFDLQEEAYKTLITDPFFIDVAAPLISQAYVPLLDTELPKTESVLCDLHTEGPWCKQTKLPPLSWYSFFIIASIPFMVCCFIFSRRMYIRLHTMYGGKRRAQAAIYNAKKHMKRAKDTRAVYRIWLTCFADRWSVHQNMITEHFIYERLQASGLPASKCTEWNMFWHRCMSAEFMHSSSTPTDVQTLRDASIAWLDVLKMYICD